VPVQLTQGTSNDEFPALSPEGKTLLFSRRRTEETMDLYRQNLRDGRQAGDPVQIGEGIRAVISPNGQLFAYEHLRASGAEAAPKVTGRIEKCKGPSQP